MTELFRPTTNKVEDVISIPDDDGNQGLVHDLSNQIQENQILITHLSRIPLHLKLAVELNDRQRQHGYHCVVDSPHWPLK